jgi:hypothetical protein
VGGTSLDNIFIINDSGDDPYIIKHLGYRCVGTRYKNFNINDLDEENRIEFENRHLKNEKYKQIYSKYPGPGFQSLINKYS